MLAKRKLVRVLARTVLAAGVWGSMSLAAEREATLPPPDTKTVAAEPTSGKLTGILTGKEVGKAAAWIAVKAEGQLESKRYMPLWHGGAPADGGGYDAAMIETIRTIPVSNLVEMEWSVDEHLRVTSLRCIVPDEKTGTVEGVVIALGDQWVDVKPADGLTERYMPRWVGNTENERGGMDKEMVRKIDTLHKGDTVRIVWKYDERKRIDELTVLASAPETPVRREEPRREEPRRRE